MLCRRCSITTISFTYTSGLTHHFRTEMTILGSTNCFADEEIQYKWSKLTWSWRAHLWTNATGTRETHIRVHLSLYMKHEIRLKENSDSLHNDETWPRNSQTRPNHLTPKGKEIGLQSVAHSLKETKTLVRSKNSISLAITPTTNRGCMVTEHAPLTVDGRCCCGDVVPPATCPPCVAWIYGNGSLSPSS